jgi:hypothetical protein
VKASVAHIALLTCVIARILSVVSLTKQPVVGLIQ